MTLAARAMKTFTSFFFVFLFSSPVTSLPSPARLLVKQAVVPFMGSDGKLLVRQELFFTEEEQLRFEIRHRGASILQEGRTRASSVGSHTDRNGQRWLHVSLSTASLPRGSSMLRVRLFESLESEGAIGEATVKVVAAPPNPKATILNNVEGRIELPLGDGGPSIPFFGLGSYTYGVTTDAQRIIPEEEAQYGASLFLPYSSEASGHTNETWGLILSYLDRCWNLGIYVHYDLSRMGVLPSSTQKSGMIETELKMVMNHPAVVAYYMADEPAGKHIGPELLEETYDIVKEIDPYKPVSVAFCCADPIKYADSYDIGMVDPYEIPNTSPTAMLQVISSLRAAGKPFFVAVQAFGGGEYWERTPTPREERVLTYLSVLYGAIGIQYYIRSPHAFPYSPNSWSECRRLWLELREISSAILGGQPPFSVEATNQAEQLLVGAWEERIKGVYVVVAVNYQNKPLNVTLHNLDYSGLAHAIFEDRFVTVVDGTVSDLIPAYGTLVYRFPPVTDTSSSPFNMIKNPSFEQVDSVGTPDGNYLGKLAVGTNPGSTFLSDSRVSVDGLHSLRLVTTTAGKGIIVTPYGPHVKANSIYTISFWAMSSAADLTLEFSFENAFPTTFSVLTSTEWTAYSKQIRVFPQNTITLRITYSLVSNGTVWVDLLQLVQDD